MEKAAMERFLGPGKKILTEIVPGTALYQAEDKPYRSFTLHAVSGSY